MNTEPYADCKRIVSVPEGANIILPPIPKPRPVPPLSPIGFEFETKSE